MDSSADECSIAPIVRTVGRAIAIDVPAKVLCEPCLTEQRSRDSCRIDRMLVAECLVPDINVGELNTTARMLNDNVAS